jgi:ABC-type antimicrobial peptide transport system permease subunit
MMLLARSERAEALLQELPRLVQAIDPTQATMSRCSMTDRIANSIGTQRYVALLLGAFAAAALLLSMIGVFGLVSYSTSQRTRELGIRMALGSSPGGVVRLVMRSGLRLVALGLALGLVCALVAGRIVASRIDGASAFDPVVYASIPAILGAAGFLACLIPARRAVRVPPASALRYE